MPAGENTGIMARTVLSPVNGSFFLPVLHSWGRTPKDENDKLTGAPTHTGYFPSRSWPMFNLFWRSFLVLVLLFGMGVALIVAQFVL